MAERLKRRVQFNGYDDPNTTVAEVFEQLQKRFNLPFDVNAQAFAADKVPDVLGITILNTQPVPPLNERKKRPAQPRHAEDFRWAPILPMQNARLETVLELILKRIPAESGATWIIRNDVIEITTQAALKKELGRKPQEPLPPLVCASFDKRPLSEALKQLADSTTYNLIIDARVSDKMKLGITTTLRSVPLDTAVLSWLTWWSCSRWSWTM